MNNGNTSLNSLQREIWYIFLYEGTLQFLFVVTTADIKFRLNTPAKCVWGEHGLYFSIIVRWLFKFFCDFSFSKVGPGFVSLYCVDTERQIQSPTPYVAYREALNTLLGV